MLYILTIPGCLKAKRAKQYFKDNEIEFREYNLFEVLLNDDKCMILLSYLKSVPQGLMELIKKEDFSDLNEARNYVLHHPSLLARPLILSDKMHLPDETLTVILSHNCRQNCSQYSICQRKVLDIVPINKTEL